MTDVEIRPLTADDDFDAQLDLGQRAFGVVPPAAHAAWKARARRQADLGLFLGAFAGGVPAGAAVIHDQRQYWLGRPVPCAGVASVKVAPEHRGRGIGRTMMTELLALMADRGYLVSALYPATVPLYRSVGYELTGAKYKLTVPAASLRSLVPPDATGLRETSGPQATVPVRRAGPEDAALVNDVIARSHQLARDAGPITWSEDWLRDWLGDPERYCYLAGEGDGFAAYRWGSGGSDEVWVERVHAATPGALRALWSVIASNASVADTVRGWTGPDDPFWWLTRERDATISRRSMWMLRVVDAPAAIAARGFPPAVSARVPLRVTDPGRPGNSGDWELAVDGGSAVLMPNEGGDTRPLTLGPRGLAALYSGIPVATLKMSGLAAGGTPDADAALDAAFAATAYMVDNF